MPTIDSIAIVIRALRNDGTYPGDPQCFAISLYTNDYGKESYHFAFSEAAYASATTSPGDIPCQPHVHNLTPLWLRGSGLTPAGIEWLKRECI